MTTYYSKETGGFYKTEIHGENMPEDAVEITEHEYASALDGQAEGRPITSDSDGHPVLAPVSPGPDYDWDGATWVLNAERQKKRATDLMQKHMDAKAQAYGYDHILSAISYADSTVSKWQTEGLAFKAWREAVWSFGLTLLEAIEAGTNTITTDADLLAALPVFPLD